MSEDVELEGKKLEIVSRDDGANPGDAVRMAEELRLKEQVAVLIAVEPHLRRPSRAHIILSVDFEEAVFQPVRENRGKMFMLETGAGEPASRRWTAPSWFFWMKPGPAPTWADAIVVRLAASG